MTQASAFGIHTLGSSDGLQIEVGELGARWMSCRVPLSDGSRREVLLGHASASAHAHEQGYLGAVVGRYANRIAKASFCDHTSRQHHLIPNEGANQLHGGPEGFDRRPWDVVSSDPFHLRLHLHSPDGDQGYPGALDAEVEYRVDAARCAVTLHFSASVQAPCPVSLASHAYFNLDGDAGTIRQHRLQVAASHYLPVRVDMIPTGELASVAGTPFDLRQARPVSAGLVCAEQLALTRGYDHCMVLDPQAARGLAPAAELLSSDGRLQMQLSTNYPGLQVYSGNHLAGSNGRDGRPFAPHAGLALEPQFFPDAPNRKAWRDQGCYLQPGQRLERWMSVVFSTLPAPADTRA
jgi:aldose 1-epimerase